MQMFLILALFFGAILEISPFAKAETFPIQSAYRYHGESVKQAYLRFQKRLKRRGISLSQNSAIKLAKPLSELDAGRAPIWVKPQTLYGAFTRVRDYRFIDDPMVPGFLRRSSWMFPDDGCFARAQLAVDNLHQWGLTQPAKVFIFGELKVNSPYSREGSVNWWYHVVPVVKFPIMGQPLLVLDPAIDASQPMIINNWIAKMTKDPNAVKLSVCHANTYGPESDCILGSDSDGALRHQKMFLPLERKRVVELGMVAENVLGDHPPWNNRLRR